MSLTAVAMMIACHGTILAQGDSAKDRAEFRRALLMNASVDQANVAAIEKLKRVLEAKGFVVTYLPHANKDGYPAYERFIRGLPAKGKSIVYYCGDVDVVKDALTKRTVYLYQLGDFKFMPPDGPPVGVRSDAAMLAPRKRTSRDPDGRLVRAVAHPSDRHLMVLDIQGFNHPAAPDVDFAKNLNEGRFISLKPEQAEKTLVFMSQSEKTGAALASKLSAAIAAGQSARKSLSADSRTLGATDADFALRGTAATVISPPSRLVAGKAAGDQWLDPRGVCFLWCPPGSFTMGCDDFADTQPKAVTISQGFWMSKYELTRHEGLAFGLSSKGTRENAPLRTSDRNRLIDALRRQRLYADHMQRSIDGWSHDLPSEAEWDCAKKFGGGG
ncbi:MAG: formylglycine-generating enzyme family protein, partial [Planctomycetales bacterium]